MVKPGVDEDGEGTKPVEIPKHLSRKAREWVKEVLEGWEPAPEDVSVAILGGEALDAGEKARKFLAVHGSTFLDRFNHPRTRPEVAIERDSRTAHLRAARQLKDAIRAWVKAEDAAEAAEVESQTVRRPYQNPRAIPEWVQHQRQREEAERNRGVKPESRRAREYQKR
jgi:hypothetical protein